MGRDFPGSATYWDRRYAFGGDSGAGSYNALADFKAKAINEFVQNNHINNVVELGCGDGNQLSMMNYPSYLGIDVSESAVQICEKKFIIDSTKRFSTLDRRGEEIFDLSLSLDVIFHLVEDSVFHDHMDLLLSISNKWAIIYSSNLTQAEFLRQYGCLEALHVRHRRFTDWISTHRPDWKLLETIDNAFPFDPARRLETSFAQFYVLKCSQ